MTLQANSSNELIMQEETLNLLMQLIAPIDYRHSGRSKHNHPCNSIPAIR